MLEMKDILTLNKDIILRCVNDKFWALNTKNGNQYHINSVTYDILSAIDSNSSVDSIIKDVSKNYDVSVEKFSSDALQLLSSSIDKGIVSVQGR